MKKMLKWVSIVSGILLGLIGLSLFGLHLYLATSHFEQVAIKRLNASIPGTIHFKIDRLAPLTGTIEFRELSLKGPQNEKIITCHKGVADLNLIALYRGDLVFDRLILDMPDVGLFFDERSDLRLTDAFYPPELSQTPPATDMPEDEEAPLLPFNIVIKSLCITKGRLDFEMREYDFRIKADGIRLTGDMDLLNGIYHEQLNVDTLAYTSPSINAKVQKSRFFADYHQGDVRVHALELLSPTTRLMLNGKIDDWFGDHIFDLALEGDGDIPELLEVFQIALPITGRAKGSLRGKGRWGNPTMALALDYGGGDFGPQRVDALTLAISLEDRKVAVKTVKGRLGGGFLEVREGSVDLKPVFPEGFWADPYYPDRLSYHGNCRLDDLSLEKLGVLQKTVKGRLNATVGAEGKGMGREHAAMIQAEGQLNGFENGAMALLPVDLKFGTEAAVTKKEIRVERMKVQANDMAMTLKGSYVNRSQRILADLSLKVPDMFKSLAKWGKPMKGSGALTLAAHLDGSIQNPAISLQASGKGVRIGLNDDEVLTIGQLAIQSDLTPAGRLHITRLTLENQGSKIDGQGWAHLLREGRWREGETPVELSLDFNHLQTRDFIRRELVSGNLNGRLVISGTVQAPIADLNLAGRDLDFETFRIGDVHTEMHLANGVLKIAKMVMQNRESHARFHGWLEAFTPHTFKWVADPAFQIDHLQGDVQLNDFFKEYSGGVSFAGDIAGRLKTPKGQLQIAGKEIATGQQHIASFETSLILEGQKILVDAYQAVIGQAGLITGKGWVETGSRTFWAEGSAAAIKIADLDALKSQDLVTGDLYLTFNGQGTWENPMFTAHAGIKQLKIHGTAVEDFRAQVSVKDRYLHFHSDTHGELRGSYHLDKGEISAVLNFNKEALTPYSLLLDQREFSGTLTGSMSIDGNLSDINTLNGFLTINDLALSYKKHPFLTTRKFRATMKGTTIDLPSCDLQFLEKGHFHAQGSMDLKGPFAFAVDGKLPLILANLYLNEPLDLDGHLDVLCHLEGTPEAPGVTAEIVLKNAGVTLPYSMQRLHEVNARLAVSRHKVAIKSFTGKLDDGRFNLDGEIGMDGFSPKALTLMLKAKGLPITLPDTLNTRFNVDLVAKGTPESVLVQGEAVLLAGEYYKDINLNLHLLQQLNKKEREVDLEKKPITLPFLKNMRFDVILKNRNPFIVDNNLALLSIIPDLHLQGSLNQPVLMGRASVASGKITYNKNTFIVNQGIIDFLDPYRVDPVFDIKGETRVKNWRIYLSIEGHHDDLDVTLTSVPAEEEADILSILLFGRPTYELVDGESGENKPASAMLAEIVATTLGKDLKTAAGLDILEFEFNGPQKGETVDDDITVTLGKSLSRRVTLKYAVESKKDKLVQKAITEYKFLDNILLNGFQDSQGAFGGELQLIVEFR